MRSQWPVVGSMEYTPADCKHVTISTPEGVHAMPHGKRCSDKGMVLSSPDHSKSKLKTHSADVYTGVTHPLLRSTQPPHSIVQAGVRWCSIHHSAEAVGERCQTQLPITSSTTNNMSQQTLHTKKASRTAPIGRVRRRTTFAVVMYSTDSGSAVVVSNAMHRGLQTEAVNASPSVVSSLPDPATVVTAPVAVLIRMRR